NGTVKVNGSASVQNSKKQDNSEYVCINSDDCMSSDNLCVSNFMNDVKFRAKPKKSKSKKDIWKPTGKVFTQIGYIWRLQFAICMCARYQARPTEKHLNAVKRIFRYLKGSVHRGLWYPKDSSFALTAFADADHASCQDTRRSTSGSIQLLGDRLVSWSSKRQKSLRYPVRKLNILLCPVVVLKSKHIDIRFHFIKEHVENGVIELYFVNTEYQLADIFTKALGRERIEFLINKLGMRSFTPETLKQLADEVDE
ncbi:hypothetical protein Tco_0845977, partial [Tanacetum coccineum]